MKNWITAGLLASCLLPAQLQASADDNTITWGFGSQIEAMNPYATNKHSAQLVIKNVMETLLYRNAAGEPRPALATSWTWVDDLTIDLTLREGVTFHNGEVFNADDVVFTVNFIKDPEAKISAQSNYGFLKSAEKLGEFEVRLHLDKPTPSAIDRLTQMLFILPNETFAAMELAEFNRAPVGTGPFKVESFEAGKEVSMVKNDTYYDADWGAPRFDKITVVTIPDSQTRLAELTSGRVEFMWEVTPDDVLQLTGAPNITTLGGNTVGVIFLSLDPSKRVGDGPTQDINVRKAMIHAIDRAGIAALTHGPDAQVLNAPCHPLQFGCVQDVATYDYDLDKAKDYMAASAYPDGFEMEIAAFTDNVLIAEAVAGNLREIGITAKVKGQETTAWVKDFFAGKIPVGVIPWPNNGIYDVSAITPTFFQEGKGDYVRDANVAGWFKEASGLVDEAKRSALYQQGFEKMAEDVLNIPMFTQSESYAYRGDLDFTLPEDGYPLMYLNGWN